MEEKLNDFLSKVAGLLSKRKLYKEFVHEFFNTGIGYIAGLLSYNYLSHFFEVRGPRNLWGVANFHKKHLIDPHTFEVISLVLSAVVGFIILKMVTHFSQKVLTRLKKEEAKQA